MARSSRAGAGKLSSVSDNVRYWIATAPVGAASVLTEELAAFGASDIRERSHDVKFQGTLDVGYRACLWSRAATRVLLSLGSVDATSSKNLFDAVKRMDWREHLAPGATLACECSGGNESIRHTIYGSQLLKDAVCDSLRDATGERPNIRPERPDVLLHLHVEGTAALVSVDFSGESLHRRGYRMDGGRAPLKENVAAAVLLRAGWPAVNAAGGLLVDPLCGSGTFLTEAALIAADAAPALNREYFGFSGWRGHDAALWDRMREEARDRRAARTPRRCILGSDVDPDAVRMSIENAAHAGVADWIHVEKRALGEVTRPNSDVGLVVTNPPYGERIGAESGLSELYSELGRTLREQFKGWQAAVLTGNPPLARNLGVYAKRTHRVYNGTIECRLLRFDLNEASEQKPADVVRADWSGRPGAQMFANRLRKNLKLLDAWALREQVECFRVYDADMPEYAFAIDLYGREGRHAHVQEYAPPKTVNQESARERRREVLAVLPEVLAVPPQHVHSRVRKPQKGTAQYEKRESVAERHVVRENGLKFWVNFRDYLDTGLFLDHRIMRQMLREWARDTDFLNLFCYTGSATVYAAAGGARSTTSVDLSNTYLDWAHENLLLNGFGGAEHELFRADCLEWLESQSVWGPRFDLIFVDPPTFSNSKRMEGVLDVQRDHVGMIRRSLKLLRPGGRLVFSTNYTRFKLDTEALADLAIEDITAKTIPRDFERHADIHRCFVVRAA
ncbi:MAG TPA: bifunctional 23S rRNA (guanine(2069)-N(7))-methyltransferase RlmK/23S rRNA (guanine(2445)-N(2))-methyltransferase RlmL [Steroidobacteraceae bacterium]|nr:bifunctional 23S rRNA (guanine(2069)-N(7))-methyltransferase RlmK/23S rRNA (guanine(2445)-N(2))-methyltransferase RlmL [Steroidobacteraceae bacterium]